MGLLVACAFLFGVLLLGPGYACARILRCDRLIAWALALPVSIGIIAGGAIVTSVVGVRYSPVTVAACVALALAFSAGLRLVSRRPLTDAHAVSVDKRVRRASVVIAALVGLVVAARILAATGKPGNYLTLYDNLFHQNMVARILTYGEASSLHGSIIDPHAWEFYPLAWHDLVAIAGGWSIGGATSALCLGLVLLAWPVTFVACCRLFAPRARYAMPLAAALALACPLFPYHFFLIWGILYPNLLGYAAATGVLGVAYAWLRGRLPLTPGLAALGVVAVVGVALAHPNAIFLLGFFAVPLIYDVVARACWKRRRWFGLIAGVAGTTLGLVAAYWLINRAHSISSMRFFTAIWPPTMSPVEGFVSAFTFSQLAHQTTPVALAAVGLVIGVGLLAALVHRDLRWLVAAHLFLVFGYVLCVGVGHPLRGYIVGYFYFDGQRLHAGLGLFGLLALASGIAALLERLPRARQHGSAIIATCAGLALLAQLNPAFGAQYAEFEANMVGDDVLSASERGLLHRVARHVPAGDRIITSPYTGSSFVWSVSGRETLFPHFERYDFAEAPAIATDLGTPKGRDLCPFLARTRTRWALVFDNKTNVWNHPDTVPSLHRLVESGQARVVDRVGEARLVKLTLCDQR